MQQGGKIHAESTGSGVLRDGRDSHWNDVPADGYERFYTLTMADILEKQGFKKDAMKIYNYLLTRPGQKLVLIAERIERLKSSGVVRSKGNL